MSAFKIRLPILMLALASAALTLAAGMMLFSSFMLYDDEGYVLMSVRNFTEHGHLYGEVYTQYGPFPYVLYYFLHACGMPLTHIAGRLLTVAAWSGAATLAAWTVWRVTRHSACMLATLSAVFVYLWIMISEPSHPGGLIALTTAVIGLLGYLALASGRWKTWAILAGTGAAVLLLTKINIGGFALLAAVAVLLLHSRNERWRRAMPWVIGLGLALLPFALMRTLLNAPWVQTYAFIFALAAVPIAGSLALVTEARAGLAEWRAAVLAGLGVAVIVLGVIFARGTSLAELVQGILLGPLQHPGHFSLSYNWYPGVRMAATVSFALFLLALAALRLGRPHRIALDTLVACLRLVAALGLALAIWTFPGASPDWPMFGYSLSCLWPFLWPLTGEEPATVTARGWLGLLFAGQWLHAFPVPGSQIAWGSFLAIPLGVIGGWQAAVWLTERQGRFFRHARIQAIDLTLTFALVLVAVLTGNQLAQIGARYIDSRSLNLPGAEIVRVPDSTTAAYRTLVFNANAHGDVLFSLPGMFSFNLWAELPTPTLTNVTHWFSLLDDAQQQAIIDALEKHPHACVIVEQGHLDFLRSHGLTPSGPLYTYIMGQFEKAFAIDQFDFFVRRGRHIAPLFTAELFQQQRQAAAGADNADTLVKLQLLLPPGQTIASIELVQMEEPQIPRLLLTGSNTRVEVTPLGLDGGAHSQPVPRALPLTPDGLVEVALYFNRGGRGLTGLKTLFVLRDAAGAELGLIRVRH